MPRQTQQEVRQRIAERRQRENDAPRLHKEIRRLTSLTMHIDNGGSRYLWRIVVERAAALFELVCPEDGCTDGGHDLTRIITHALRASATRFEGESACHGDLGARGCGRILKYVAEATYRD